MRINCTLPSDLEPKCLPLVIDLVREAGVDVSDWAHFRGGAKKAAANPRYCYEWAFLQPGKVVVLNLWQAELEVDGEKVFRQLNWRQRAVVELDYNRKRRASAADRTIAEGWREGLPIRVIILSGTIRDPQRSSGKSEVTARLLDPVAWAVTSYDATTGDCQVVRGATPLKDCHASDEEEWIGFEGDMKFAYLAHRARERNARSLKLEAAIRLNGGQLICEVPNCGFDFEKFYGPLGAGYAQVHHKISFRECPPDGRSVRLEDLAVVCANCHAMIHRGGACRAIETLIPPKSQ